MNTPTPCQHLFVADQPLLSSQACRELLDMALSAAAFDLPAALLLRGPAVLWVATDNATPDAISQKDLFRQLGALPVYGITEIYVAAEDLGRFTRHPKPDGWIPLDAVGVKDLYNRCDRVIQL